MTAEKTVLLTCRFAVGAMTRKERRVGFLFLVQWEGRGGLARTKYPNFRID